MLLNIYGMWPWYISGPVIGLLMLFLVFAGKSFGVSANFRSFCSIAGAAKYSDFFNFNWRSQIWNILFLVGAIIGGFIAASYLEDPRTLSSLDEKTVVEFQAMGIHTEHVAAQDIHIADNASSSAYNWIILLLGGFFIGFGARYAGGCTSGHAISGISARQIPSLIAVVGFFIGGLFTTYVLLPTLF